MARQKALINPELLAWARKNAGYDVSSAATKLKRSVEELETWESGEQQPTLAQARRAAELSRRPLAVFYLPGVPRDFQPPRLPDFRRLPDGVSQDSPQLRLLIRVAQERQDWAREMLLAEGQRRLRWVGSASIRDDEQKLGVTIRKWLGVTVKKQGALGSPGEGLHAWIEWIEAKGAYIFQSGGTPALTIQPEEARGLALMDDVAPFIVINAKDAETGRVFTLGHELVHLWIGAPGISNREPIRQARTDLQRTEVFCNRVAAEILMPARWLEQRWEQSAARADIAAHIAWHARQLRVSREAVARRAADIGKMPFTRYLELRAEYQKDWSQRRQTEGGPEWAMMVPKRAGYAFTRMVLSAYRAGEITGRDVSALLNSKLKHLGSIAEHVGAPDLGWGQIG